MMTIAADVDEAVRGIPSGSTVLVSGFGKTGQPIDLLAALLRTDATDLTVVSNNAGNGDEGLAILIKEGRVRRIVCSFPRQSDSWHFEKEFAAGRIELELVPQGTLAERIRAGGAGIAGFFTATAYGTPLAEGKETRIIDGRGYVLEEPIRGDFSLIKAHTADRLGNLTFRKTARNFGPIMASAATTTIVQVTSIVPAGQMDPDHVVSPGIFTDVVVATPAVACDREGGVR
jgi:3-oxoadipate CoA-transferase alpha subunit